MSGGSVRLTKVSLIVGWVPSSVKPNYNLLYKDNIVGTKLPDCYDHCHDKTNLSNVKRK